MKSYSQFRHEIMRKRMLENLAQSQPVLPAQPGEQQPVSNVQQPIDSTKTNTFFKGMNFPPSMRWKMLQNAQKQGQNPSVIPGQPPTPQTSL